MWSGNYSSWAELEKECGGYDSASILSQVADRTRQALKTPNVYERDGCLIQGEPTYAFELLQWIKNSASGDEINVIDFGGSLGTTYHQLKPYLSKYTVRWNIIEQSNFVDAGKEFEDGSLYFYKTIEECLSHHEICTTPSPTVFISSSTLAYIENAWKILEKVANLNFEWVLLDRMSMTEGSSDRLTKQVVPPEIYDASYPCWFFGEEKLINNMRDRGYKHLLTFQALGDDKGYVFQL
jgi:putative methyltransferase (TIGR04325 family)